MQAGNNVEAPRRKDQDRRRGGMYRGFGAGPGVGRNLFNRLGYSAHHPGGQLDCRTMTLINCYIGVGRAT